MAQLKVLIADDHEAFRGMVHRFLDKLGTVSVVGEAVDGIDAVQKVEELKPDVVLMDVTMPNRDGLHATRIIKRQWPEVKVLIVTMHADPVYELAAQNARADGFIHKTSVKPELESFFGDKSILLEVKSEIKARAATGG